jgi:hypothetical protein
MNLGKDKRDQARRTDQAILDACERQAAYDERSALLSEGDHRESGPLTLRSVSISTKALDELHPHTPMTARSPYERVVEADAETGPVPYDVSNEVSEVGIEMLPSPGAMSAISEGPSGPGTPGSGLVRRHSLASVDEESAVRGGASRCCYVQRCLCNVVVLITSCCVSCIVHRGLAAGQGRGHAQQPDALGRPPHPQRPQRVSLIWAFLPAGVVRVGI